MKSNYYWVCAEITELMKSFEMNKSYCEKSNMKNKYKRCIIIKGIIRNIGNNQGEATSRE